MYYKKYTLRLYRVVEKKTWSEGTLWKQRKECISTKLVPLNSFVELEAVFVKPFSREPTHRRDYLSFVNDFKANEQICQYLGDCDTNKHYRQYVPIEAPVITADNNDAERISETDDDDF